MTSRKFPFPSFEIGNTSASRKSLTNLGKLWTERGMAREIGCWSYFRREMNLVELRNHRIMTHGRYLLPSRSTARSVLPFQSSLDQWTFLNPKHPVKLIEIQYPPWNYQRVYPWIGRPSQKERIISQPSFFSGELLTLGSVHSADSYILGMISDSLSPTPGCFTSWGVTKLWKSQLSPPQFKRSESRFFSVFKVYLRAHGFPFTKKTKSLFLKDSWGSGTPTWGSYWTWGCHVARFVCQRRLALKGALGRHDPEKIKKHLSTWCINPSIVPIFKHLNRADLGVAGRDSHSAIQMGLGTEPCQFFVLRSMGVYVVF